MFRFGPVITCPSQLSHGSGPRAEIVSVRTTGLEKSDDKPLLPHWPSGVFPGQNSNDSCRGNFDMFGINWQSPIRVNFHDCEP